MKLAKKESSEAILEDIIVKSLEGEIVWRDRDGGCKWPYVAVYGSYELSYDGKVLAFRGDDGCTDVEFDISTPSDGYLYYGMVFATSRSQIKGKFDLIKKMAKQ